MNNNNFGLTRSPSAILFGDGQRHALGRVTAHVGQRALICTDERLSISPLLEEMLQDLTRNGVAYRVFDGTQPELPSDGIETCVQEHRAFNPDVVIGMGGGSCLDMAKLVALSLSHGGSLEHYYGELKVPGPVLPVIAIPTTAGTGSEVTPVAVMADKKRDLKVGISSPYLIPHIALCDPELTVTCPPGLTALSGADALTHAIEAFTAVVNPADPLLSQSRVFVGKNLLSDQHALTAIKAIFEYLPRAVENGADREARSQMMFGSLQAGLAFGVAGTAAAHAIQYPVGALTHTAHGLGVAALLPYVMRFNAETHLHAYVAIARAIGITTASPEQAVDELIHQTRQLLNRIGIPRTLADLGVQESQLDWIAEQSLLSARLINNNPRRLELGDLQLLTRRAFHGHL
ncbi:MULTISPECIES: iron-containing alcohol dehydrogenase [Pseudomonas]|uniref:Alcohol dehydrogenase n=1 Tax=Pseudomonas fluorescens LMG 5329 TaxID=1324332 RepID=A0A0A1Z8A9_PSEFL|nr:MULTISPECIES: iron-containing alcohol dehydrogenase [Pseudomonas]KGE69221.1 alcohol dehydrogenase [Pseudomonas fluorescens LMG 5329]NWE04030.1 iron-containing alcohol dehydrogenase [Pseudomonas sp. IPO3749]NWF19607.1 iron-containing alcohol dehydrogenase [Pseudomonas sp. IPO3749]